MSVERVRRSRRGILAVFVMLAAGGLPALGLGGQQPEQWQEQESADVRTVEEELAVDADLDDDPHDEVIADHGNTAWVSDGFVFIEGSYLSPPYRVQFTEGRLRINGQAVDYPLPDMLAEGRGLGLNMARFTRAQQTKTVRRVGEELASGGILVSLTGCPTITLNHPVAREQFLKLLSAGRRVEQAPPELIEQLPTLCREGWGNWLAGFTPGEEVQQRAAAHLELVATVGNSNWAAVNAVRRLDKVAYPLTILGMVVVVLAFGHLLLHRPEAKAERVDESPEVRKLVVKSMLLVVAFSVMDLVWTLLASQAGQMRELNPLGSRLIADPLSLIAFKAVLTAMSVGLILGLRKYRTAQVASWWACLICTLLTVRWLVFNSMFVT
ncbi:MAG: hypothetical protein J5I93_20365 [Pirellulaceae bacterium]|nr:hypothetical protein [Pirellulaceae bacterium]